jgi:hypothetical protein
VTSATCHSTHPRSATKRTKVTKTHMKGTHARRPFVRLASFVASVAGGVRACKAIGQIIRTGLDTSNDNAFSPPANEVPHRQRSLAVRATLLQAGMTRGMSERWPLVRIQRALSLSKGRPDQFFDLKSDRRHFFAETYSGIGVPVTFAYNTSESRSASFGQ